MSRGVSGAISLARPLAAAKSSMGPRPVAGNTGRGPDATKMRARCANCDRLQCEGLILKHTRKEHSF